MSGSSDSDQHRRPGKNGKDAEQDRHIRDVYALVERYHDEDRDWKEKFEANDDKVHAGIASDLNDLARKFYAATILGRVFWGAVGTLALAVGGLLVWLVQENASIRKELDQHIAFGKERGEFIEYRLNECTEKVDDLRRRFRPTNNRSE